MPPRIYFDNAATTPLDPRVCEAMQPYLRSCWGNPSSLHREGREAREAVEAARSQVAELLGAEPGEIVFTSSGTEADSMAIWGVALAAENRPCHVIASSIEHPAVLECCCGLAAVWRRSDASAGRRRGHRRSGRSAAGDPA